MDRPVTGIDGNIDYLGVRDLKALSRPIEECDLGIIPNHRNIFTEIIRQRGSLNIWHSAKPVIAPKAKGSQDYFGDNDLIFRVGNADDLARKSSLPTLIPEEVADTVKRGRRFILPHVESGATQFVEFHQRASVERLSKTVDASSHTLTRSCGHASTAEPDEQKQRKEQVKVIGYGSQVSLPVGSPYSSTIAQMIGCRCQ